MSDFLKNLQEKPYDARVRILWAGVAVAAVIMAIVLIFSIKYTLRDVDKNQLINLNPTSSNTAITDIPFASVERVEKSQQALKIFFNLNNPTDDILNVPQLSDITLRFEGGQANPKSITDRQGKQFVQKILSKTQNFGILIFDPISAEKATLSFDHMYLEKSSSDLFQQKLELNLTELSQPIKLRE